MVQKISKLEHEPVGCLSPAIQALNLVTQLGVLITKLSYQPLLCLQCTLSVSKQIHNVRQYIQELLRGRDDAGSAKVLRGCSSVNT